MGDVPKWLQIALSALVAFIGALWWLSGIDSRVDRCEKFLDNHDTIRESVIRDYNVKVDALHVEITRLRSEMDTIRAECPLRFTTIERRLEFLESITQRTLDLGSLVRDSNDLQRQRMKTDKH